MSAIEISNHSHEVYTDAAIGGANILQKGSALGLKCAAFGAFAAPLLTRLVLGYAFFQTGSGKWSNIGNTVDYFTSLGIPAPAANAYVVATLELVGGIALMLGLGTRLFALALSSTMVVAILTAERQKFLDALLQRSDDGLLDVVPFAFLLFLTWIVFYGPGALSLDRVLSKWLKLGAEAPEGKKA